MTSEESIKYLKKMKDECNDTFHKVRYVTREEALDMAIKALETLEEFEKAQIITGGRLNGRTYAYKCGLEDGKRKALEQEPKTGHWIAIDEEPHEDYECDKCGYIISTYTANIEPHTEYKYCPNCGAKMKNEVQE